MPPVAPAPADPLTPPSSPPDPPAAAPPDPPVGAPPDPPAAAPPDPPVTLPPEPALPPDPPLVLPPVPAPLPPEPGEDESGGLSEPQAPSQSTSAKLVIDPEVSAQREGGREIRAWRRGARKSSRRAVFTPGQWRRETHSVRR